jgi:hypothetical protein
MTEYPIKSLRRRGRPHKQPDKKARPVCFVLNHERFFALQELTKDGKSKWLSSIIDRETGKKS